MSDTNTSRRVSERTNKGTPPANLISFEMPGVKHTPPRKGPAAEKGDEEELPEDSAQKDHRPERESEMSREFNKKMDDMRNEFSRQLQAMQALMMSTHERMQNNMQELKVQLRNQPAPSSSILPSSLNSAATQNLAVQQMQWAETCLSLSGTPTIVNFSQWLNALRKIASTVTDTMSRANAHTGAIKKQHQMPATGGRRVNMSVTPKTCILCKNQCESLADCRVFLKMSLEDRWRNVKELKLCFSCLKTGHRSVRCFAKKKCSVNNCTKIHHRLLHNQQISAVHD